MTDPQLLYEYCQRRSEPAFAELVQRHAAWVYAAALRQVRDHHIAEDVTQAVFIALAKKAPRLRQGAAVSGWLFKAMRYAASHAIQAESRRQKHERRTAAMVPESMVTSTEVDWEPLAPHLDKLVGKLRERDRQAVLLRFYQQKTFVEVGQAMGITEEAARKCTDRAVAKLREMFVNRGLAIGTPMNLAAAMTQHLCHPPIFPLLSTTIQTALAGNQTILAEAVMRALAWVWMKVAIALITIGLAITATGIFAARATSPIPQTQTSTSSTPPGVIAATKPETKNPMAKAPGVVQIARWDVILNQSGADSISDLGYPVPTASKIYRGIICGGDELRRAIDQAMATGGFENGSTEMMIATENPGVNDQSLHIQSDQGFLPSYETLGRGPSYAITGSDDSPDIIHRIAPTKLHIQLNHAQMRLRFGDYNPQRNMWTYKDLSGESIVFDGNLSTGEALAFLGQFTGPSGATHYHLMVWETFTAAETEMPIICRLTDTAQWCQIGPDQMRRSAAIANAWGARAVSAIPPAFEKHLDDGLVVRLAAISHPSEWWYCWWNGDGAPVAEREGMMLDWPSGQAKRELQATDQVKVVIQISGPPAEWSRAKPDSANATNGQGDTNNFSEGINCSLSQTAKSLEVGVPVGPWVELGHLQLGGSLTSSGIRYSIDNGYVVNDPMFNQVLVVGLRQSGSAHDQLSLVAVRIDGKEIASYGPQAVIFGGDKWKTYSPNFAGTNKLQVKYFRLWSRKRQWVTFSNFVTDPNPSPATITDTPAKTSSPPQTSPASSP